MSPTVTYLAPVMGKRADAVGLWMRAMRRRNLSPLTIDKRASVARRLSAHAGVPLLDVTTEQIYDWLDSRTIGARTRYTDISHVAAFFHWAIRDGHTTENPTERIDRPKVPAGIPRPIDTDDLRRALMAATCPDINAMMYLAAFAGLRCAEIAGLDWADINGDMMLVHGKGGKDRVMPVHPLIQSALRAMPNRRAHGSIFGLCPRQVSHSIRRHLHDAGVVASAHQLRHWFATAVYEASGADLRMTQELLGHSSPTTTAMYTRWSQSRSSEVVAHMTA